LRIVNEIVITDSITLRLVVSDITARSVDAIVNPANSNLKHGGGVAGAIVKRGGITIQEESDKIGFVPVGTSVVTSSGALPCKGIIHTVGPRMGEGNEDDKLRKAICSCLDICSKSGFKSISIPAISTGIFGFPKEKCAKILVREAFDYLMRISTASAKINLVEFCVIDSVTLEYFDREFSNIKSKTDYILF
jgi:O-acetyl-ADP-ribose deacetylase (regulator of RNase III)